MFVVANEELSFKNKGKKGEKPEFYRKCSVVQEQDRYQNKIPISDDDVKKIISPLGEV
jgi:hypothetical protein